MYYFITTDKPTYGKCGKKHYGDFLKGTENCFGYAKSGDKVRDFPKVRDEEKVGGQAQASDSNESQKNNHLYALCSRGEQETSPDVVTDMLKVFSIDVYVLLDPDATLSFVPPLVAKSLIFYMNLL